MSKIFKIFSKNKKTLLLIIGMGLILSLTPSHFAYAAWWDDLIKAVWNLPAYILSIPLRIVVFGAVLMLGLIALGASVLFSLITALLTWMMGVFMQVPIFYNMPMVQAGWTFCRDFANMFFVLLLAFIGLSTILKLKEYESKKTLPRLIMIALLVNFSPVIVGFVVDISNIITNFFITNVGNLGGLAGTLTGSGSITDYMWDGINLCLNPLTDTNTFMTQAPGYLIYGIALIVFFLYASWIYFLFTLIFLLRVIYLWMLTILAPIAFLSYVPPPTKWVKKLFPSILHWDEWWERLIQWAIVGIPMGFFLYLANYLLGLDVGTIFSVSELGGLEQSFIDLITNTLGPTVALLLLHQGYKISKDAMPEAAKGIIEGVKKVGAMATAVGITAVTAGAGAGAAAGVLGKTAAGAQRLEAFMGKVPIIGKPLKYGVGKPISWATRGMEMAAAPSLLKYAAKTRRVTMPDEFDKMSPAEQEQHVRARPLTPQARIQYGYKMADLGTLDKTNKDFQEKIAEDAKGLAESPYYKKEVAKIMGFLPDKITQKMAIDFEVGDEAKRGMEEKIEEMAKEISADVELKPEIEKIAGEKKITEEQAAKDIAAGAIHVGGLGPGDVAKIAKGSLKTLATRLGTQQWTSGHLSRLRATFDKETVKNVFEGPGGLNTIIKSKEDLEKFYKKNPRLVRSFAVTPSGREWGWKGIEEMDKNEETGRPDFAIFEKRMTKERKEAEKEAERAKLAPLSPEEISKIVSEISNVEDKKLKRVKETMETVGIPNSLKQSIREAIRTNDPQVVLLEEQLDQAVKFESELGLKIEDVLKTIEAETNKRELMKPPATLPKIKKGTIMPDDIIRLRKEGRKYISGITKNINKLGNLNEMAKDLERQLVFLKEMEEKTPEAEEFIKEIEEKLLPKRREEIKSTQESINKTKKRLREIREEIGSWEELKMEER